MSWTERGPCWPRGEWGGEEFGFFLCPSTRATLHFSRSSSSRVGRTEKGVQSRCDSLIQNITRENKGTDSPHPYPLSVVIIATVYMYLCIYVYTFEKPAGFSLVSKSCFLVQDGGAIKREDLPEDCLVVYQGQDCRFLPPITANVLSEQKVLTAATPPDSSTNRQHCGVQRRGRKYLVCLPSNSHGLLARKLREKITDS